MATNVIVVNGPPRAGKDTLVEAMMRHYADRGHHVASFSSIDPIRDMLTEAGIDTSAKTQADRALLAAMGTLLEQHSNFRTNWCVNQVLITHRCFCRKAPVVFLHVREPENIDRIEALLAPCDIRLWRVFVESDRAETTFSNPSDANVFAMKRNFTVQNNGSLKELEKSAAALVDLTCLRKEFSHAA